MKLISKVLAVAAAASGIFLVGYSAYRISSSDDSPVVVSEYSKTDTSASYTVYDDPDEAKTTVTTAFSATESVSPVTVISQTSCSALPASFTENNTFDFPADINKVTKEQLMEINTIGEATASAIINYRNQQGGFHSLEELLNISGVGDKKYQLLKQYLYVTDDMTTTAKSTSSAVSTTVSSSISTEIKTSASTQITASVSKTAVTAIPVPARKSVNINIASADEIAECLLIDMDTAEAIVMLREQIGQYANTLELLYVEELHWKDTAITYDLYNQIKDYCLLE